MIQFCDPLGTFPGRERGVRYVLEGSVCGRSAARRIWPTSTMGLRRTWLPG